MKTNILLCIWVWGIVSSTFAQEEDISYRLIENISYASVYGGEVDDYMNERCKLDIYYPENKNKFSTVVWFHGGGLTSGQKSISNNLKNKGIAVVSVNYRLSPKVKCPVYIEDAAASVAWVFRNIEKYGGDRTKVFVSGHSAGGYLASMIGLDKGYLAAFGFDANSIAGLIPFSGHAITHMTVRKEMGINEKQPVVDKYAPLFHVRSDAPPLILITGDRELELLGRYEENAYLYRMMIVAGHKKTSIYEMPGFNHGTMTIPADHILLDQIKNFKIITK